MIDFLDKCPLSEPVIFDSHAHYDDRKFDEIRDELLKELPNRGISGVIDCGCDVASSRAALSLSEKYDYIYAAVGIHPENIGGGTVEEIKAMSQHEKCVAIGEIGLDYYWVSDNKNEQCALFSEQLMLANSLSLPVIVHDREAHADTLELIRKYRPQGVLHSFSGSVETAKELLELGLYIGIGGVITFKNAKKLPEVVKMLPEDRFLLETDAPYLTPAPYRSKINHSAMIYFTAEKIAEIKNISIEKIFELSRKNAERLFLGREKA